MPRRPGQPPRRRVLASACVSALLATAWVLLVPAPSDAHAVLVSSSPSDGDVVRTAPSEVSFTFDEGVLEPAFVSVSAPDGASIATGPATVDGAVVTQQIRRVPEQGGYTASYRVVSDDGHSVTGTIHFKVDPAHEPTAASSSTCVGSCDSNAGTSFWHRASTWVVLALSAFALAVALVFAVGLRSSRTSNAGGDG